MDWAHSRQWFVWSIMGAFALAILCIIGFAVFYKTPTCFDTKQNGEETGIDCGGTCSTVCSSAASPARVRFARTLQQSGRNDVIAYIDNVNTDAYTNDARVDITIYTQDGHTLEKHALVSLPANSATPLYLPGIANAALQQVFISFAPGQPVWMKGSRWDQTAPKISNVSIQTPESQPRVTAMVFNQTAYPQRNVPLVASVFADDGSVIAASQTVVRLLPPQGSAAAVFTWNEPFSAPVARVEIIPLSALPSLVP